MLQTFFLISLYFQKYDLNRLTLYHLQSCVSQFCDITKGIFLQKFSQTEQRHPQLVAVSSLSYNQI